MRPDKLGPRLRVGVMTARCHSRPPAPGGYPEERAAPAGAATMTGGDCADAPGAFSEGAPATTGGAAATIVVTATDGWNDSSTGGETRRGGA